LGALSIASAGAVANQPTRVTIDANDVWVYHEGEVLLRYSYGAVPYKPYVKELFTPNGLNVLLDAPSDHLHHHGLMLALGVGGTDFWAETPDAGRQQHARFDDVRVGKLGNLSDSGFAQWLYWIDPAGQKVLSEKRTIAVRQIDEPNATILSWESYLSAPLGGRRAELTGRHYFGLGLRFIRAMDAQGEFRNADNKPGKVFRGEERLVQSEWCAYTAPVDGNEVTVAMFGHPDNPRVSTTWFTMAKPFAYLAATLALHEEPMKLGLARSARLQYGVALWDRAVSSEDIDGLYQQWLESVSGQKRRISDESR
jgi:hypothetical protein